MITPRSNMAVIDVETTGLVAYQEFLLEIACIPVDADLDILDEEGYHAVVSYDELEVAILRAEASVVVRKMHDKTGLWNRLTSEDAKPLHEIDEELTEYLSRFGKPKTMPLVGNSPRLDFNFIDVHLPKLSTFLDYHMRDVSTIAGAAEDWYGQGNFVKGNDHTAMTDVRECIKEFRHYRDTIFRTKDEHEVWAKGAAFHHRAKVAENALKEIAARLQQPIAPYGDESLEKVTEIDFLRDAYGDDLADDLLTILREAALVSGNGAAS